MSPRRPQHPPSARRLSLGALLLPLAACALAKGVDSGASATGDCEINSNPLKFGDFVFDVKEGRTHLNVVVVVLEDDCAIPASDWSFSCPSIDPSLSSEMDGFRLQPDKDVTFDLYLTSQLATGTYYECGLFYKDGVADTLSLNAP